MKRQQIVYLAILAIVTVFLLVSLLADIAPGKMMVYHFLSFGWNMLKVIPVAFILIGLFEVWVKRETVEKHMGKASGLQGYFWGILLSATTVGGLYVAFPVSYSLHVKGARLGVIFAYLSASAICRIPMTIFEASFMGVKFTLLRFMVSLPLVILTSIFLGYLLEKMNCQVRDAGESVEAGI